MPLTPPRWGRWLTVVVGLAIPGSFATAQTLPVTSDLTRLALAPPSQADAASSLALSSTMLFQTGEQAVEERTDVTGAEGDAGESPFSFDITYYLYSDYIFRGINRSEYGGEGREKPNHQVTTNLDVDIGLLTGLDSGTCGTFSFGTFFEWYAAQKRLNPAGGGQNLQEVDYLLAWSYDIESLSTAFTLGYNFYTFPNVNAANTSEWWFSLEHNDAWMWTGLWPDNEDAVLNPSFAFYQDVDIGAGSAIWMEFGLSHAFDVAENLTVTPSWTLAVDHNYYHYFAGDRTKRTTRLANMLWGVDATYDMTEVFGLPEGWGSVALSGFVYFSDALGNPEDKGIIQDEFFGGMSVGWSF